MASHVCVSSGTIAQDDLSFDASRRNVQCMCVSVCAVTVAMNVERQSFTTSLVDRIVVAGDNYYAETKRHLGPQHTNALLSADEVAPVVSFGDRSYSVRTERVTCGTYPVDRDGTHQCSTAKTKTASHVTEGR